MIKALIGFGAFFLAGGCSLLTTYPDHLSQKQRHAMFSQRKAPISNKVIIHWEEHSIPFVEAQNDRDLAFAVGTVHAHLRLGQLELLRRVSQGRLSEVAGPIGVVEKIDQFLRVIDFRAAGKNSLSTLNKESQMWLQQFTAGINWYIEHNMKKWPAENKLFGEAPKPFAAWEVLTMGKLIGADLTWGTYVKYLKWKEQGQDDSVFLGHEKSIDPESYTAESKEPIHVIQLLKSLSKSGSNSLVVGGKKTTSGSGMIASDPHVGLFLPNFWLLMGIKSPNYHAIGYMIPGVPFIGVGRNKDIAWGGTNMRGISSHLFEIPKSEPTTKRTEIIKRRWWSDKRVELEDSKFGPVFNDNAYFDQDKQKSKIALYWLGREGSDELQTFLNVQKAKDWNQFRRAFDTYRISAMNILYADKRGNVGMIPAYGQPILKDPNKTLELVKSMDNPVVNVLKPTEQTNPYNPEQGYIASANNKPFSNPSIPYSFSFANNDRVDRMKTIMKENPKVSLETLKSLQLDVYSEKAHRFAKLFKELKAKEDKSSPIFLLSEWNGKFTSESHGAVACELFKFYAWQTYMDRIDKPQWEKELINSARDRLAVLIPWVQGLPKEEFKTFTAVWSKQASAQIKKTPTWGQLQQQPQQSPFGMIPGIGGRFRLDPYPAAGGDDTLNKSGRQFSNQQESVTYGASARHISDLSGLDENYFVMHGGNDGWLLNESLADQTPLWRKGEYIKLPMRIENVRKVFSAYKTELMPQSL